MKQSKGYRGTKLPKSGFILNSCEKGEEWTTKIIQYKGREPQPYKKETGYVLQHAKKVWGKVNKRNR